MHLKRITTWDELSGLAVSWNALAGDMPLRSWDWLATWWKHYGARAESVSVHRGRGGHRQLYVLAVYGHDRPHSQCSAGLASNGAEAAGEHRLLGIAPWFLERSFAQGNALRWLGSGEACTDHLSLICRAENHRLVATALANALANDDGDWDLLDLHSVDADDVAVGTLISCLTDRGCLAARRPADSIWTVDLPPCWEEYLATLSKSHRKQLRQLDRRVLDSERACWHRVERDDQLDTAWQVLVDLHQRRRRSLGEPGCFASRAFHDFHREVAGRLLARGQLRLSWLALDGRPAAAEYHVAGQTTTYAYQGGVDPSRLDQEPGRLSSILCLRRAILEGHTRFDFLRGDEPYKAHWRAVPQAACHYRVVANRRLARLRGRLVNLAGSMGGWVQQTTTRQQGG